jgi:hypothetical protein
MIKTTPHIGASSAYLGLAHYLVALSGFRVGGKNVNIAEGCPRQRG